MVVGGKPAAGVNVFFLPTSTGTPAKAVMNPHGTTDADGTFQLTTYVKDDGAPEGNYMVMMFWQSEEDGKSEADQDDRFFGWHDAKHTKLSATVKAGTNTLPTISVPEVKGPPPVSQGIPGRN